MNVRTHTGHIIPTRQTPRHQCCCSVLLWSVVLCYFSSPPSRGGDSGPAQGPPPSYVTCPVPSLKERRGRVGKERMRNVWRRVRGEKRNKPGRRSTYHD